jgi:hypothetical protein
MASDVYMILLSFIAVKTYYFKTAEFVSRLAIFSSSNKCRPILLYHIVVDPNSFFSNSDWDPEIFLLFSDSDSKANIWT